MVLWAESSSSDNEDTGDDDGSNSKKAKQRNRKPSNKNKMPSNTEDSNEENEGNDEDDLLARKKKKKEELLKAIGQEIRKQKAAVVGEIRQQQQQPSLSSPSLSESASSSAASSASSTANDGTSKASSDSPPSSTAGLQQDLLDRFNPFKAGQKLRKTLDTTFTSLAPLPQERKSIYLDDRFMDRIGGNLVDGSDDIATALARLAQQDEDYSPEVLVIGATGEVGRRVVQALRRDGRFRIRVLVRDLYTKTLQVLGTGVTYCQGDLANQDSLEYALTDVDKVVFCAGAPRRDEEQFRARFEEFKKENLQQRATSIQLIKDSNSNKNNNTATSTSEKNKDDDDDKEDEIRDDDEWEQLDSVLEVRAQLAEQIDFIGMQNVVRAYQHVRHADYGTSQAAKRSLFKFQDRPEDFNLFAIEGDDSDLDGKESYLDYDEDDEDDYDEDYNDEDYNGNYEDYLETMSKQRRAGGSETYVAQSQWLRNKFEHGVFVGRVPAPSAMYPAGGEAAIVSTRLRSREDPDYGIELGTGFAGFIVRVCSDGGTYEAFVRTGDYYEDGIEYVCTFSTATKTSSGRNKSSNKFTTVRLPFTSFRPVQRRTKAASSTGGETVDTIAPFNGRDVRNIGFRYRSENNPVQIKKRPVPTGKDSGNNENTLNSFYLALSYIKLYRSQPEPEFVYLSDARIPPVVRSNMVRHDAKQLVVNSKRKNDESVPGISILDGDTLKSINENAMGRSPEEVYYKYRGEEVLKNSGLSYTIIRFSEYNESPTGELSTLELKATNEDADILPVSRSEIAEVCVSALLDPNALNKSFYVSKKQQGGMDKGVVVVGTTPKTAVNKEEELAAKFASLPADVVA